MSQRNGEVYPDGYHVTTVIKSLDKIGKNEKDECGNTIKETIRKSMG